MQQIRDLYLDILKNGEVRNTRSGDTLSVFRREFVHDMRVSFPVPDTKLMPFHPMMGELLWFANGLTDLPSLRRLSNLSEDAWTIWTNDCKRWHSAKDRSPLSPEDLGRLYGVQWRNFGGSENWKGVDQLQNLVNNMMNSPTSRYLLVQAYNPLEIYEDEMALPPCHTGFQVYVSPKTDEFDLDWTQRSVDSFLGLPFNISSYAALMEILGSITGLTPRYLSGSLKDTHLYMAHMDAVHTQLLRTIRPSNVKFIMPEIKSLDDLKSLTSADFHLEGYNPQPAIKAQLSVG